MKIRIVCVLAGVIVGFIFAAINSKYKVCAKRVNYYDSNVKVVNRVDTDIHALLTRAGEEYYPNFNSNILSDNTLVQHICISNVKQKDAGLVIQLLLKFYSDELPKVYNFDVVKNTYENNFAQAGKWSVSLSSKYNKVNIICYEFHLSNSAGENTSQVYLHIQEQCF